MALCSLAAKFRVDGCQESLRVAPFAAELSGRVGGDDLIVFGGAGGNFLLEELRRGSTGTMPGCTIPEVFRRVWDLFQEGKDDEAAAVFDRYAPLLKQLGQGLGMASYLAKEVLRLRGVFKAANVRPPAAPPDDLAYREIRHLVEVLGLGR